MNIRCKLGIHDWTEYYIQETIGTVCGTVYIKSTGKFKYREEKELYMVEHRHCRGCKEIDQKNCGKVVEE